MIYSESESVWLTRRAAEFAKARAWPLPIAWSEPEAELTKVSRIGEYRKGVYLTG